MILHRIAKVRATEFPKELEWVNSPPLTLKELAGKVVLIDFWTYSCLNCHHAIAHVKEWQEKYKEKGLVIIGVHSPEFAFEKESARVRKAIEQMGITYAVVLDSEYKIWNLYANRWWPRSFVIDRHGFIVYDHIGEHGYAKTESAIQHALAETGAMDLPAIAPDPLVGGGICYRTTPETYLGYLRGRYGNGMNLVPNTEHAFTDTGVHEDDLLYLHGHWQVNGESISHIKELPSPTEYIAIKYSALSVNIVMGAGKSAEVEIEFDGMPLPSDMAGADVEFVGDRAIVHVADHRLYKLVSSDTYHKGTLKIRTKSKDLSLFALTFGSCKEE
ncbi:MAG: redoxin family protein [Patescibacteria group bacterium]|jgi:thiol-disulfide isomerase/thioredoxin